MTLGNPNSGVFDPEKLSEEPSENRAFGPSLVTPGNPNSGVFDPEKLSEEPSGVEGEGLRPGALFTCDTGNPNSGVFDPEKLSEEPSGVEGEALFTCDPSKLST